MDLNFRNHDGIQHFIKKGYMLQDRNEKDYYAPNYCLIRSDYNHFAPVVDSQGYDTGADPSRDYGSRYPQKVGFSTVFTQPYTHDLEDIMESDAHYAEGIRIDYYTGTLTFYEIGYFNDGSKGREVPLYEYEWSNIDSDWYGAETFNAETFEAEGKRNSIKTVNQRGITLVKGKLHTMEEGGQYGKAPTTIKFELPLSEFIRRLQGSSMVNYTGYLTKEYEDNGRRYRAETEMERYNKHRDEILEVKAKLLQENEEGELYIDDPDQEAENDAIYEVLSKYYPEVYGAETFDVEFNEWADQELMSHGKDISFKDWAEDEGMKHGNTEITDWAQHEEESHDARYGAEMDNVKHQHYQDMITHLESLNELTEMDKVKLQHYKDMVKMDAETFDDSFITTDMSPSYIDVVVTDDIGSSFEGRLYGTMKENHSGAKKGLVSYDPSTGNVIYYHKGMEFVGDVENSDMNYSAEDNIKRFKVGEQYTHRYYHGYGFSDYEVMRRTDKSVWFSKVNPETGKVDSPLLVSRHKLHTMQPFEHDGEIIDGLEMVRLQMGYPVKAGQTTMSKYAETSGQWEIGEQLEEAQMNAERKKRSSLLSEPHEGTSLDSGDWKGIVVGFGIGLLGLFGYSKLRK